MLKSSTKFSEYSLVKSGHECGSEDTYLDTFDSLSKCSKACKEEDGCKYFLFGTGSKKGKCYWEKTNSAECTDGWKTNQYDFYEIIGLFHFYLKLTSYYYVDYYNI